MKWQIMLFNSDTRWALNMKINDWNSHFPPFCETSSCCLYTLEQQEWNILYLGSLDWYFFFFLEEHLWAKLSGNSLNKFCIKKEQHINDHN